MHNLHLQLGFQFFIKSQNFSKESYCLMWDETEFHVIAPRYFAESLALVTCYTECRSRSFCSGSCLRFDVNIESKKLSEDGLFKDLYTWINTLWHILAIWLSNINSLSIVMPSNIGWFFSQTWVLPTFSLKCSKRWTVVRNLYFSAFSYI